MKIPRKRHIHETQPSRGTKRRRDEEQIKTKQTPRTKPQTHKEERTRHRAVSRETTERRRRGSVCRNICVCGGGGGGGAAGRGLKPILLAQNLTYNSDAAQNYKYMFGQHRGPLPHL